MLFIQVARAQDDMDKMFKQQLEMTRKLFDQVMQERRKFFQDQDQMLDQLFHGPGMLEDQVKHHFRQEKEHVVLIVEVDQPKESKLKITVKNDHVIF